MSSSLGMKESFLEFVFGSDVLFQEEHERIMESRIDPDSDITWEEYKSMKFTSHVCQYALELSK